MEGLVTKDFLCETCGMLNSKLFFSSTRITQCYSCGQLTNINEIKTSKDKIPIKTNFIEKKGNLTRREHQEEVRQGMFNLQFENEHYNPNSTLSQRLNNNFTVEYDEEEFMERLLDNLMRMRQNSPNPFEPQEKKNQQEELKAFQMKKKSNTMNDNCCICLLEMKFKEKCSSLKCKHTFHYDCIKKWLNTKSICPFCRTEV